MYTVAKLNGSSESFSPQKLKLSIIRAAQDMGIDVNGEVDLAINRNVGSWELADMVQLELLKKAIDKPQLADVAKAHLLGRIYKEAFGKDFLKTKTGYGERAAARFRQLVEAGLLKPEASELLGLFEPKPEFDKSLSYNALRLFTNGNYALRDSGFKLAETPSMAAWRVATAVARSLEVARRYYDAITAQKIVPASPFWFNAWTKKEMFASCFTLEVEDCLSSITHPGRYCIYDALAYSGIIQQLGGGVGYDFSLLRPEGDVVRGSVGVASGPISFMKLFDTNVDVIKQGGKRRGAQMGTLHVWHPDVKKFIKAKTGELKDAHLQNFNISVFVDDTFMEKALGIDKDPNYRLINPRMFLDKTGAKPVEYADLHREAPKEATWGEVDARDLFREIAEGAWDSGDPGLIYKANLNASNPLLGEEVEVAGYKLRYIWRAVNPCVTGDTRVLTRHGYVPIAEVYRRAKEQGEVVLLTEGVEKDGDPRGFAVEVLVPHVALTVGGKTEVEYSVVKSGVIRVGTKDVYRVVSKEGFEIKATPDHRLLVIKGTRDRPTSYEWKRVDELKPGDLLVIAPVEAPEDVGEDTMPLSVAYLLGRIVGDGSITVDKHNRPHIFVYFAKDELDDAVALVDMLKMEFGSDVRYSLSETKTQIKLEFSGTFARAVASMVPELIHSDSKTRRVPEVVFRSKPRIIAAFLRGLFDADGTVDADSAIRLTSSSRELLRDVQQLLLLFGIYSVVYERKRKTAAFRYVTKDGIEKTYTGGETYYELVIKDESRCRFMGKIGLAPKKAARVSLKKCKREKPFATVEKVEYLGREVVYDFGVPEYHRYIAEGIVSHNCAETVQNPFEVCNLTHINLVKFVKCAGKTFEERLGCIDWEGLAQAARIGTRFLEDAIERSRTGIKVIDEMNAATRKNGLGIMGFAELLLKLGVPYASWEAVELINRIMGWIYVHALDESAELARERGPFKFFEKSVYARGELPVLKYQDFVWGRWEKVKHVYPRELQEAGDRLREITMRTREWLRPHLEQLLEKVKGGVRNSVVLSIAPTGRTSILAGTTSGVEPIFALAFVRNVTVGTLIEFYEPGIELLKARGLWTPQVRRVVEETGMLRDAPVPDDVKHLLATAMEIGWLWHVLMQASAQQWVDQGISKTINMPANAPKEDVYWAFAFAWAVGVKGITVYRDKSKSVQVIYTGLKQEIKKKLADTKILIKPAALEASIEEAAEKAKLKALEEGKDPYCKTGECG